MAFEGRCCEFEKLLKIRLEEQLAAAVQVADLKVDLQLGDDRHKLFVKFALFQDGLGQHWRLEQFDHLCNEVPEEGLPGLGRLENGMPHIRQVLQTQRALDLHLTGRIAIDRRGDQLEQVLNQLWLLD